MTFFFSIEVAVSFDPDPVSSSSSLSRRWNQVTTPEPLQVQQIKPANLIRVRRKMPE